MARRAPLVPSESAGMPWRRYLLVATFVVVVAGALFFFFYPRFQTSRWIADLHALNPKTVRNAREALRASQAPGIEARLVEGLSDPGLAFDVRVTLGQILLERNRLPLVEQVLREGSLAGKRAALATIYTQVGGRGPEWFQRDYVERQAYDIEGLLLSWLEDPGEASRRTAARIAGDLGLQAAAPALREIVRSGDALGSTKAQRSVLSAAAGALIQLGDCEAVASFVEPAKAEPEDVVRLRMMQALYRAVRGPRPTCPEAVPPETVKEVLFAALDGLDNTTQGALILLKAEPLWALEVEERLLEILDEAPVDSFHRRHALDVLAATGSAAFARRLPRYFHDPNPFVRSEAALAAMTYARDPEAPVRYVDAWIGLLQDERENENAFFAALGALKNASGRWFELPEAVIDDAARGGPAWQRFREELFREGKSGGVTREGWAETWWRWWAGELGLSAEAIDAGWAARRAFWEAARGGDLSAARAALDASPRRDDGLFTYEEGWLDRQAD